MLSTSTKSGSKAVTPKINMPHAIIFDLDDTLYDERHFVYSGFKAVAQYLSDRYGLNSDKLFLHMQSLLCEEGRGKIFDRVLQSNGLDTSLVCTLVEVYRSHNPVLELYPDARKILRYLKERVLEFRRNTPDAAQEVFMGLITDGAACVQWNKVRALGLEDVMDMIVITDDLGADCWKPSPVPYQRVMDELGILPESCIYIGDNPEKDFFSARELGWHTVRIWRPGGMCFEVKKAPAYEADFDITDLCQLKPILNKLWGLNYEL